MVIKGARALPFGTHRSSASGNAGMTPRPRRHPRSGRRRSDLRCCLERPLRQWRQHPNVNGGRDRRCARTRWHQLLRGQPRARTIWCLGRDPIRCQDRARPSDSAGVLTPKSRARVWSDRRLPSMGKEKTSTRGAPATFRKRPASRVDERRVILDRLQTSCLQALEPTDASWLRTLLIVGAFAA